MRQLVGPKGLAGWVAIPYGRVAGPPLRCIGHVTSSGPGRITSAYLYPRTVVIWRAPGDVSSLHVQTSRDTREEKLEHSMIGNRLERVTTAARARDRADP